MSRPLLTPRSPSRVMIISMSSVERAKRSSLVPIRVSPSAMKSSRIASCSRLDNRPSPTKELARAVVHPALGGPRCPLATSRV